MSHFAKVENNIVVNVIVAEQEFINLLPDSNSWVQTSYNTSGGVHSQGGIPMRKNYAGVGYNYDSNRDAFIPPKPFNSWILNEATCLWEAPVMKPVDGKHYGWNEDNLSWEESI